MDWEGLVYKEHAGSMSALKTGLLSAPTPIKETLSLWEGQGSDKRES